MLKQDIVEADFLLSSYRYNLPEKQIAQQPKTRGSSRLLVIDQQSDTHTHTHFSSLLEHLSRDTLLVANNSQVLPVRLICMLHTGGRIEVLLLTPVPFLEQGVKEDLSHNNHHTAIVEVLIKPAKKISIGTVLTFHNNLEVVLLEKRAFGCFVARISWSGSIKEFLLNYGQVPLPPYIQRENTTHDINLYQTLYAKKEQCGSIAAPTAGMHFSSNLMAKLEKEGVCWEEITLHVGYGTFSPVRSQNIQEHIMHKEYVQLSQETVEAIRKAKKEQRPIVAIGTTVVRALEGVLCIAGDLVPYNGWINTFITPGYSFRIVDGLITNFHQPESTLLMLVSAFIGRKRLLEVYQEAIQLGYRFFSYGDAMFIK